MYRIVTLMTVFGVSMASSSASPCFLQASQAMDVPVNVLELVAKLEGGKPGQVRVNKNGSEDLGRMQINSWWLPRLEALGISRDDVLNNDCVNVHVAAWILAQERMRSKNWAGAIAGYHSQNPRYQTRYLTRALNVLEQKEAD